jgi:hypothetical protein
MASVISDTTISRMTGLTVFSAGEATIHASTTTSAGQFQVPQARWQALLVRPVAGTRQAPFERTGVCSEMTKGEAEAILAEILRPIHEGAARRTPPQALTLEGFVRSVFLEVWRRKGKVSTAITSDEAQHSSPPARDRARMGGLPGGPGAATRRCAARPTWTPRRAPIRWGITSM